MILCNGVFFVHIPKCGGTSIKAAMQASRKCVAITPLVDGLDRPFAGKNKFDPHLNPYDVLDACGELFRINFVFTVVRNPWERFVSWWAYKSDKRPFQEFLTDLLDSEATRYQSNYFRDAPDVYAYVAHLESINEDWQFLQRVLDIRATLPKLNASTHKHYREYYTQELVERVAAKERVVIDRFNYSF